MDNPAYKITVASDVIEDSLSAEIELSEHYFGRIFEIDDDNSKLFIEFEGFQKQRMELEFFKEILLEAEKRIKK